MQPQPDLAAGLPDELPGQSNCAEAGLSHHDAAAASPASLFGGVWNSSNPAVSGLSLGQAQLQAAAAALRAPSPAADGGVGPLLPADWLAASPLRLPSLRPSSGKPVLNEVVCGTLMLAYERAGLWQQASILGRGEDPSCGLASRMLMTPVFHVSTWIDVSRDVSSRATRWKLAHHRMAVGEALAATAAAGSDVMHVDAGGQRA